MGLWDGFANAVKSAGNWALSGGGANGNFMNTNLGSILGAGGGLWGAYNQQKMANKQFGLQKDAFNYNKMLSDRELKRQDEADNSLKNAFMNSTYYSKA